MSKDNSTLAQLRAVTEADIEAAQDYLAGATSRYVLEMAAGHLRPEVIRVMVERGLLPEYVKP